MRYKFISNLFLFFLLVYAVSAQTGDYKFTRLNNSQGLLHNQINCIFKDSQGYMWFGTRDGLNRYDGYRFMVFRNDPKDPSSISDNYITDIYEDSKGRFWVGTKKGLNLYNRQNPFFYYIDTKLNGEQKLMQVSLFPIIPSISCSWKF